MEIKDVFRGDAGQRDRSESQLSVWTERRGGMNGWIHDWRTQKLYERHSGNEHFMNSRSRLVMSIGT